MVDVESEKMTVLFLNMQNITVYSSCFNERKLAMAASKESVK